MLTWPHANSSWGPTLAAVEPVFFALAIAIARREALLVVCPDEGKAAAVKAALLGSGIDAGHIVTAVAESNDTWARDHGPITVLDDGEPRILDFRFNGWGNKYAFDADNAINGSLASQGVLDAAVIETPDLVLEGGSIDSDGAGSLLTTTSCLLNPQRNPDKSGQEIEQSLCELLGARRVLWLEHGEIEGDDTDGHIDMLARFSDSGTLLYQSCDEPEYSGFESLQSMQAELQALRTLDNRPYQLVPLPWPGPRFAPDGARMPASYANFLVINGAVLVPSYNDPADDAAAAQIQRCFPGRDIVQIDCLPLIEQHGSLHCLTMQFPHVAVAGPPIKEKS